MVKGRKDIDLSNLSMKLLIRFRRNASFHLKNLPPIPRPLKKNKWRKAMEEEITSIEKNDTWMLWKAPKTCKPLSVKLVYKLNKNPLSEVVTHKARFLLKVYH